MPVTQRVLPPRRSQLAPPGNILTMRTASVGAMFAHASRAFQPPTGAGRDATCACARWIGGGVPRRKLLGRAIAAIWNIVPANQNIARLGRETQIGVTPILCSIALILRHPISELRCGIETF